MRRVFAILAVSCLLSGSVSGQKKYWTTFFVEDRVTKASHEVRRCDVALDQEKMESMLRDVDWPLNSVKPAVDWEEDAAVIIAPTGADVSFTLSFIDLKWTGREFMLNWGWWNSHLRQYRGPSTITFGQGTSKHQVLVVVVKRYVYTNNKLFCQEYEAR